MCKWICLFLKCFVPLIVWGFLFSYSRCLLAVLSVLYLRRPCMGRWGGRVVRWHWVSPVHGASYNLNDSRARPIVLAVGAGGGCLDILLSCISFSPLSPSLWETVRYRLKYCLKGPLNPKQPTNQIWVDA